MTHKSHDNEMFFAAIQREVRAISDKVGCIQVAHTSQGETNRSFQRDIDSINNRLISFGQRLNELEAKFAELADQFEKLVDHLLQLASKDSDPLPADPEESQAVNT